MRLKLLNIVGLGFSLKNLRVRDNCKIPIGVVLNDAANMANIATRVPQATPTLTGVALTFLNDSVYGSKTTPETGNITASITGALLGVTNLIIHNSGTEPTFDAKFHILSGSGSYVTSAINYIFCTYITTDEIIYSIQQRT